MTIYEQMKAANVQDMSAWQSDLYVPVTSVTTKIIAGYEFKHNVTTFQSRIRGEGKYYEIPFAYDPHYPKEVLCPRATPMP